MPVVSRPQRTEAIQAKYNVTVDFPHLGLHSAAATGNLGLVKYALEHGQPINSVLDGVLPLHAACSGGNEHVVRLLIEKGADVNAPRLPRRFSNDRSRDAPIVGTSGSTPLHFACANGHASVVLTLLMHGAHPNRADKHGTTPEMLARQNGWIACADMLRDWTLNKDRDLREKEELIPSQSGDGSSVTDTKHTCGGPDCRICNSKRLRVKRSIDHALNMLKPSLSQLHSYSPAESVGTALETIVASPLLPSDYTGDGLVRDSPESVATGETTGRRPSLPDVFDPSQISTMSRRSHGRGSGSSSRRPRSAGNDAEPQTVGRRVKGKVSLLSIFKKADASTVTLEGSSPGYASSSYTSSIPSVSGSPAPGTPRRSDVNTPNESPIPPSKLSEETSFSDMTLHGRTRGRVFSEGETTRVPPLPTAVELHRALSDERSRTLSSPGPVDVQAPDASSGPPSAHRSPSLRPGILRPHNRSISQQSQGESPRSGSLGPHSSRSLRFDSTSTTTTTARPSSDAHRRSSQSPARAVKMSRSVSSMHSGIGVEATRSPLRTAIDLAEAPHDKTANVHRAVFEDDEEEYGEPITTPEAITELDSRLTALQVTEEPKRNSMFSQASLSPLPSPTKVNASRFDCPFSINDPPPEDVESQQHEAESPAQQTFLSADGNENRARGDSMSSMSTTGTGGYLPTPGMQHIQLPSPWITQSTSTPPEYPAMDHGGKRRIQRTPSSTYADADLLRAPKKGPPSALDIDVGTISSYAQAEALVQRTQRSILDLQDVVVTPQAGTAVGIGQTPLSAKLAAYGESLAIERKFRQEEEERRNSSSTVRSRRPSEYSMRPPADSVDVEASPGSKSLDRKFSLEERSYNHTVRQSKVRRPHTAGSTTSSDMHLGSSSRPGRSIPSPRHLPASGSQLHIARSSSDQRIEGVATSYTPPMSSFLSADADMYAGSRPRVPRSRTPDPCRDDHPLYCDSSPKTMGVPLSRVSTAPVQDCASFRPQRGMTDQERQVARATKLVKMGFNADSQSASAANRYNNSNKHRFGGFKGFVQSLNLIGK